MKKDTAALPDQMQSKFLALICIAVLGVTLSLGLWPFHSPSNGVAWLGARNGLRFGKHSTVIGSRPLRFTSPQNDPEASLEIWFQPDRIWDSGTVVSFYRPGNLFQFSLRQSQKDLLIRTGTQNDPYRSRTSSFYVNEVFPAKVQFNVQPVFLTITTGARGTWVYTDGGPFAEAPRFPLSASDFTGQMVLGDSPGQPDGWVGKLLGVAIYQSQLTPAQVLHHFATWTETGRPELALEERNAALYLFDERGGEVIRDKGRSGVDLHIPKTYQVIDKIALEPFWTEFSMTKSYWSAAFKNIIGLMPFGFCFYAWLAAKPAVSRAALVTVALGTAVSLTIEVLQAFLPTRDSGTTDIFTNTLGTWLGVASYQLAIPIVARFFPWLPFPVPPVSDSHSSHSSPSDIAPLPKVE